MTQPNPLAFIPFTGTNFGLPGTDPLLHVDPLLSYPTPGTTDTPADEMMSLEPPENFQLPPQIVIVQLANIFFEHLYPMFPCFHKKRLFLAIESGQLQNESPILLYAICCVAARHHPEDTIKRRSKDWYEQAKFSYELTRQKPEPFLRIVQAVLLLIFHAWTIGDFSSSWLFLGKAWRQAVVLCLNVDANCGKTPQPNLNQGKTSVEKEEHRRALWLLFMMDRTHSWPTGWPVAIPETQFKVDFPKPESAFQAMDPESHTLCDGNTPFTRNLSELICSSSSAKDPLNVLHYIAIAHVLLGRVSELVHSPHSSPDSPEYAENCAKLDNSIVKFRISLPRQASSVLAAPPADREHVVWLQVTLNAMAIILHYRRREQGSSPDSTSPSSLALIAARNVAQVAKDASRISVDLLLSAHIGSSLYIAACVLVIQWRLSGDESLKDDIDLFTFVFERMDEEFIFLGLKFKSALEHDMKKSREELLGLQEWGFRGLLADCKKWDYARLEAEQRGLEINTD
ncbi:uncharacterized protein yc1106_04494 [Curvularia clavata]|uniref:Xylanolytic transcriptional activator regulatory domain-containing protein n=1 Tax=Curvularia clavata TaxID=95742 RepID=A0A9Q8Z7R7_CURCL|nr:uncharacterized protein yc1106_04494 [Curvularia clavata]